MLQARGITLLIISCVLWTDVSEMTDQVYMEVIVGEDEAPAIQEAQLEDSPSNKTFVPVAWAAAYGLPFLLFNIAHLLFFM